METASREFGRMDKAGRSNLEVFVPRSRERAYQHIGDWTTDFQTVREGKWAFPGLGIPLEEGD